MGTRIPRAAVERFYAPGTDGGAHKRVGLDQPRPALGRVADAAIEFSDNAAADALLERAGSEAVDRWARRRGMKRQDPIYPLLGEFAAWTHDPEWADRFPQQRAQRAQLLAGRVQARSVHLPGLAEQRRLAEAPSRACRGSGER